MDWDVAAYEGFHDLRLRPALDLLARVPLRRPGRVVDLGCGSGAVAAALAARFPEARRIGVDPSPAMREAAQATGRYAEVEAGDAESLATDRAAAPADLLYSNAALHWAPNHERVFPALLNRVAPGGVFAVQMPRQFGEPSHQLLWRTAARLFPERFAPSPPAPLTAEPAFYRDLLAPGAAAFDLWETVYHQRLEPSAEAGHPVAAFTDSTAARPYLDHLAPEEQERFRAEYAAALAVSYPLQPDGSAWLPFRRLFIVVQK